MLPTLGIAVLPSNVSPATLDMFHSGLNLSLHCVDDIDELNLQPSSPDC